MISLTEKELSIIKSILIDHSKNTKVLAIGSRIKGTHKKYSDLDLVFFNKNKEKLGLSRLSRIKETFEESDLAIKVDVIDYYATSPEFQKIIDERNVIIFDGIQFYV